jgi:nucleotide-binding universal stress UspA family protein
VAGLEAEARGKEFLEQALARVAPSGVPTRGVLKVAHRISQGILETAREEESNFVILGRQQKPAFLERLLFSVIDVVVQEAPCEVLVLHGRLRAEGLREILIPFGTDVHTRLAVELAPAFVKRFGCRVRIGVVFPPETNEEHRRQRVAELERFAGESGLAAEVTVIHDREVLHGVLDLARRADLIVMAGQSGKFLELLLGQSLTRQITEEAGCPVLWVKEYEEKRSFWKVLLAPDPAEEDEHG